VAGVILCVLILAQRAAASIEPALVVNISFSGPCHVNGFLVVTVEELDLVVMDRAVEWSAAQPIDYHQFGPTGEPGQTQRLQLVGPDHSTVLFESTRWVALTPDVGWEFKAELECTTTPYVELPPDGAVADRNSGNAWRPIALIAMAALILGMAGLRLSARRSIRP